MGFSREIAKYTQKHMIMEAASDTWMEVTRYSYEI